MNSSTLNVRNTGIADTSYNIKIGSGLLSSAGKWTRSSLPKDVRRLFIVSDKNVYKLYGEAVTDSLTFAGFDVSAFVINAGESSKNIRNLEACLAGLSENKISRTDAVIALGGGVVGDLAGFAAAVHLRGIRFLQLPTTLLAMVDSSVGGKTGVNSAAGKNLIGAFHQPSGVMIDVDVLGTLPARELTAGFCEMVKHGAISGKPLLKDTDLFLGELGRDLTSLPPRLNSRLASLIKENVRFKARIVAGDERESSTKNDAKSRKILNFGHTLAHALEKVTDYKLLRHGEAVGYGILFAAELSKSLALLNEKDVILLNDVVHRAGPLPDIANVDIQAVLEAFRFDKKQVSGLLQFILLEGIGKPSIVSQNDIPFSNIKEALRTVLR